MYGRFAFGLRRFLRTPLTKGEAEEIVRRALADRENNFLRLLRRGVFEYPKSPYHSLFQWARCRLDDIEIMLRQRGLDKTLLALRESGVYVSFEECKGREPIVRNGKVLTVHAHDFDNPWLQYHYTSESGGSTGAGTRVHHDLDHLAQRAARQLLTYHAHGVVDAPAAVWRGVLPDGSGINTVLTMTRFGRPPQKWFTPVTPQELDPKLFKFRAATQLTVFLSRMFGVPIPRPERVPVDRALQIARWARETLDRRGACIVDGVASRALRVCVAARDAGLDLTGATFVVAGEPVTPAKAQGILATGARYFPTYGFSEAGRIGMGCARPSSSNDLHLLTDTCAVVPFNREAPGSGRLVPAFNVTTLLPTSPKILINAESDDYGVVEERSCGCPLGDLGLTTHVSEIRSFRKLTGEGVTLVGSEMLHILEEVLPSRFGGTALDYQLMEEEDDRGFTRISLVVSPGVSIADEAAVVKGFLDALGKESVGAGICGINLAQAGAIRIKRMQPVLTGRGKLLPLSTYRRS